MAINIAIKLGTTYTSIFMQGQGIVLHEPSVLALTGKKDRSMRLFATGKEAADMIGKTPEGIKIVSPIKDGMVVFPNECALMLKEFLRRVQPLDYIFAPKYKAILGIPLGINVEEREMYEQVCLDAGISHVTLVPNIVLSAVGVDFPLSTARGGVFVNIGGGLTEVAVLSLGGIIKGCSIGLGGEIIDKAIVDSLIGKRNMKVSFSAARKLREEIASLMENDISFTTIDGVDVEVKRPRTTTVTATDLYEIIYPYYLRIAEAVKNIVNHCPPDMAQDILTGGVFVTGGASNLMGLESVFSKIIEVSVKTFSHPEQLQIIGGGKLLLNPELLALITR